MQPNIPTGRASGGDRPGSARNGTMKTKPPGRGPPLITAEYRSHLEASIADQASGGQGDDARVSCVTAGMPRMMTATRPFEMVVLPAITYVYGEGNIPRRIYTDGRDFPKDEEPSYMGYSIGKWIDDDDDGKFDVLEVETRNFKGPAHLSTPAAFRCTRTIRASSRSAFSSTRPIPTSCAMRSRPSTTRSTRPWTVTQLPSRTQRDVDEETLRREQQSRRGRQGILLPVRRRLPDADPQERATSRRTRGISRLRSSFRTHWGAARIDR